LFEKKRKFSKSGEKKLLYESAAVWKQFETVSVKGIYIDLGRYRQTWLQPKTKWDQRRVEKYASGLFVKLWFWFREKKIINFFPTTPVF
jgi:hypothetical protein